MLWKVWIRLSTTLYRDITILSSNIDLLSPIGAKQQSFLYIYLKSDTNVQLSTRLFNKDVRWGDSFLNSWLNSLVLRRLSCFGKSEYKLQALVRPVGILLYFKAWKIDNALIEVVFVEESGRKLNFGVRF
jgi:hypothetical protein